MRLKEGKPPREILENIIYKHLLALKDPDVVQGPAFGEDAGIVRLGDGFLVTHTDPITAASRFSGWLSVHIACNDVAVRGARPRWILSTILLRPGTTSNELEDIILQIKRACRELGVSVIGGHTEVTPGIPRTIIVSTAIGHTRGRVIRTCDARPGDRILIAGVIGGEGASVIAWDFADKLKDLGVPDSVIEKARELIWQVSVVDKALLIKDLATAMHDPTEGGVIEGLLELAIASHNRVKIYVDSIKVPDVVGSITKPLGIDPLRLLSSGALIATIPEDKLDEATSRLVKKRIPYTVCGEVSEGEPALEIHTDRGRIITRSAVVDEIYKLWS